jgi:hypothetical protein
LQGMSSVVKRFLLEKSPDRHITNMTSDELCITARRSVRELSQAIRRMNWKPV